MDEQKQSLIDRIKQAQNILVTVSANPNVDQLSAAIGLTIALNKLDKHGTAVFSGQIPSTLEFLKPEETLEKNTDSLRDFIIALDKSKADKLRYKVEDQVVRIFITPYKTSLSQADLDFSQGDFNVDVVVALGVTDPADLDTAITSHGRILHDATVASLSVSGQGSLGTINWVDPGASSLSEMVVSLVDGLDKKAIDGQIATALLTGIVASTERFSNDKTSPKTMSASAELMAAGANQQLIATQLETPPGAADQSSQPAENNGAATPSEAPKAEPGTLEISHPEDGEPEKPEPTEEAEPEPEPELPNPQVQVNYDGQLKTIGEPELPAISRVRGTGSDGTPTDSDVPGDHDRMSEPPMLGDPSLTANSQQEQDFDPPTEELSLPAMDAPLLTHNENLLPPATVPNIAEDPFIPQQPLPSELPSWQVPQPPMVTPDPPSVDPIAPSAPAPTPWTPPQPYVPPASTQTLPDPFAPDTTLTEIEQSVDSPHLHANDAAPEVAPVSQVDDARSAVEAALSQSSTSNAMDPITALNAQPLGPELHAAAPAAPLFTPPAAPVPNAFPNTGFSESTPGNTPADDALDMPLPSNPFGPGQQASTEQFQTPQSFAPPAFTPAPASPSAFPGAPQQGNGQAPPPPVPPPMLPPLQ